MLNNFTETELSHEQWKDIEGYDGAYQVSDLGRVRSHKSGEWRVIDGSKDSSGYLQVGLYKGKKAKLFSVHRLVAQAFIPNDDSSKTIINHIDECKQNNRVSNIEWCDYKYNSTYNDIHLRRNNGIRRKIKPLYNPELTINENLEVFKSNGIECNEKTVRNLRKDLKLERPCRHHLRDKIKELYRPELSIDDNLEVFRANGIECSSWTVKRIRKDLGLNGSRQKYKLNKLKDLYDKKLSYNENIKVFKENGIECCITSLYKLRKDLGLVKSTKKK